MTAKFRRTTQFCFYAVAVVLALMGTEIERGGIDIDVTPNPRRLHPAPVHGLKLKLKLVDCICACLEACLQSLEAVGSGHDLLSASMLGDTGCGGGCCGGVGDVVFTVTAQDVVVPIKKS